MPLYVLTAELLTLHIRNNPNIKGITHPSSTEEVKLSQYADVTSFTLRDKCHIQTTFETLTHMNEPPELKLTWLNVRGFGQALSVTTPTNFFLSTGSMIIFLIKS